MYRFRKDVEAALDKHGLARRARVDAWVLAFLHGPMRTEGSGFEAHSKDRLAYVQRVGNGWGVWWRGWRWYPPGAKSPATYDTREEARAYIRALKSTAQPSGDRRAGKAE